MAAAQLRLLSVFGFQLLTDAVQELDVGLLWILLESGDKGPGHGTSRLTTDGSIRSEAISEVCQKAW